MTDEILISGLDASVNFVRHLPGGRGAFEARYVSRKDEYFIVYLSSHAGCDKACRMCHLTQMGQTDMTPATLEDYLSQARRVMMHYAELEHDGRPPADYVNFNFMARGEPFANPIVLSAFPVLDNDLRQIAADAGIGRAQLNLSTIMPLEIAGRDLKEIIGPNRRGVNVYYSLYSMDKDFRKRWLPKAMDPMIALTMLAEWQMSGEGGEVVLHWPFIAGANDSEEDVEKIIRAVRMVGLKTRFNLVRYNPFSAAQGVESDGIIMRRNLRLLGDAFGDPRTQIVPRVGGDVKASCGMFVNDGEPALA
ncbi:methyltransferase [Bajunvirus bajun]|uniref:Methyltransferase n=1 Tax=Brevundimonas phage vB_BgoS-Bajun TaxID=2948594 RepID=A0A9E7N713_9CAUD|nr:methyltransferase [Brevundimonas phage vB_BgoS-Bajun]